MSDYIERAEEHARKDEWDEAAFLYKSAGEIQKAAQCYLKAGHSSRNPRHYPVKETMFKLAAECFVDAGQISEAIEAYLLYFKKSPHREYLVKEDTEKLYQAGYLEDVLSALSTVKRTEHWTTWKSIMEIDQCQAAATYALQTGEIKMISYAIKSYEKLGDWEEVENLRLKLIREGEERYLADYIKSMREKGEFEKALRFGIKCLSYIKKEYRILNDLHRITLYKRDFEAAVRILEQRLKVSLEKNEEFETKNCQVLLATSYIKLGEYDKGTEIIAENTNLNLPTLPYSRGYESDSAENNKTLIVKRGSWRWEAELLDSLGDWPALIDLFVKNNFVDEANKMLEFNARYSSLHYALQIAKKHDLPCRRSLEREFQEENDLFQCGHYEEVLSTEKKRLSDELEADRGLYYTWMVARILELLDHRIEEAIELYNKSIEYHGEETVFNFTDDCFYNLARLYFKKGRYTEAAESLQKNWLSIRDEPERTLYTAAKLYSLAENKTKQRQVLSELEMLLKNTARAKDMALIYFGESLYEDFDRLSREENLTEFAAALYEKEKMFEKAEQLLRGEMDKTSDKSAGEMIGISSEKECPSCGKPNKDSANFCIKCGTPLSQVKEICPNPECGMRNEPDASFCEKCGARM